MKKLSNFIVEKRYIFIAVFLILALVSVFLMTLVTKNNDLTQYLPSDSPLRQGVEIMSEEFTEQGSTLKVMFTDLSDTQKVSIQNELKSIKNVESVSYENNSTYEKDNYTLFILKVPFAADSGQALDVKKAVEAKYKDVSTGGEIAIANDAVIPTIFLLIAFAILIMILFTMCQSWIEPFLFLATIGIAVVINMGTNIMFTSVSIITHSLASILQLCLSMDYSIMLLSRYRQEKLKSESNQTAMKNAISGSFSAVFSSSFTTIAGLLVLLFMSFTIGADMGAILAKGVLISLLCVFFVLPTLILWCDKLIEKTSKKSLHIKMDKIGKFSYKARKIIPIAFVIVFVLSFFARGWLGMAFSIPYQNNADIIFQDKNTIIVLYDNKDEDKIGTVIEAIKNNEYIDDINCYATTLGIRLSSTELALMTGMNETMVSQVFGYYFMLNGASPDGKIAMYSFINFIIDTVSVDPSFSPYFTDESLAVLNASKAEMDAGYKQLVGNNYSRLIINTSLPEEGTITYDFIDMITDNLNINMTGQHYIIGNSMLSYEMNEGFNSELDLITILTILAIFIVVAVTFRSAIIPTILVCIIQCAVFITMGALGLLGGSVYFLAILIVQAILMGATVDYGILYTSYYKECRKTMDVKEAIITAYNKSIHTILTSSLILFAVTGIMGLISTAITSQVCLSIAIGTFCATTLIIFILPAMLALFDKLICRKLKKDLKP